MVVTNPADEFPADLQNYVEPDPYKHHPAAFVYNKVPTVENTSPYEHSHPGAPHHSSYDQGESHIKVKHFGGSRSEETLRSFLTFEHFVLFEGRKVKMDFRRFFDFKMLFCRELCLLVKTVYLLDLYFQEF